VNKCHTEYSPMNVSVNSRIDYHSLVGSGTSGLNRRRARRMASPRASAPEARTDDTLDAQRMLPSVSPSYAGPLKPKEAGRVAVVGENSPHGSPGTASRNTLKLI
jgi:hypothetical protein